MYKILNLAVITYILTGCSLTNTIEDKTSKPIPDINGLNSSNEIFTYYKDPAQFDTAVEYFAIGKFITQENCLFFELNNELYTPVFPANYTIYKESDAQIVFGDEVIKIGETVNIPATPVTKKYMGRLITKAPDYCLIDKIVKVQTRYRKS